LFVDKFTSFLGYEHKNVDFKVSELPEERHFQYDERTRFRIFALSADKIEKVIKELEDLCHEVITDKVFEGGVYEEKIEMLSDEQVERTTYLNLQDFSYSLYMSNDDRVWTGILQLSLVTLMYNYIRLYACILVNIL